MIAPLPIVCKFTIIRSSSYYSINKLFNIKTNNIHNMAFKLKAWQIYLIGVAVIPLIIVSFGFGTGRGLAYDIESGVASTALIGGIVLGIYYGISKGLKKKDQGTK